METIPATAAVTVFVCANCARPAKKLTSARRTRPVVPDLQLPCRFQQIVIPCTGRLQPEHVLRAFENGSSVVSVIACQDGNCHYIEGSRRCALRVDYLRSILKDIGLGEERLLLSYLPGSAAEDLALAAHEVSNERSKGSLEEQIAAIRDQVMDTLRTQPPNPLEHSLQEARNVDVSGEGFDFAEDESDE